MILVDATAFIDWMRQGRSPTQLLQSYVLAGEIVSCGVVRAEVIRGIIRSNMKEELTRLFDVIPEVPTDARLWSGIAEMAWSLDRKGNVLPLTDLIIAACALRVGAVVISSDQHFKKVPGLKCHHEI